MLQSSLAEISADVIFASECLGCCRAVIGYSGPRRLESWGSWGRAQEGSEQIKKNCFLGNGDDYSQYFRKATTVTGN
jgi:hypothetical protein